MSLRGLAQTEKGPADTARSPPVNPDVRTAATLWPTFGCVPKPALNNFFEGLLR